VVNVTGTVATRDVGGWEIVASAEGVLRASRLTATGSSPSPSLQAWAQPSPLGAIEGTTVAPHVDTGAGDLVRPLLAMVVGLGIAAALAVAGGLAMASRRRRARSRSATPGAEGGPRTNERA
jgi:hypothetical protein